MTKVKLNRMGRRRDEPLSSGGKRHLTKFPWRDRSAGPKYFTSSFPVNAASAGKRHCWQGMGWGWGLEGRCGKVRGQQMVSAKRRLLSHAWVCDSEEEMGGPAPCTALKSFF